MKFWKMHFHGTRLKKPVFCKKVIFGVYFLKIMFNYLHVGRATDLIDDKDRHLFRLLEVMPGFLAWLTLFLVALLFFLFLYKEDYSVFASTIEGLLKTNYPKSKMVVVICWEERGGKETESVVREVEKNYKNVFLDFVSVMHPANLPDEIPGKGSNTAYAAKMVRDSIVDVRRIPYDHILVSNLDIDTVVFPEYFGILMHTFLTTPNPLRSSYQPIPLYVNNIWEAPSFARVVAFAATFWHTVKQEKAETATT